MTAAAAGGLALGALGWMVFAGHGPAAKPLGAAEARLEAVRAEAPRPIGARLDRTAQIAATPLFTLTTGPGAVAEAPIRLDGLSQSGGRSAALVSIDGKPAEWLELGATRDGVTLRQVLGSKIVVDTATGFREIALGGQPNANR